MIDRLISCLVALGLATLVWLYARSRDQEVLDNVPIPVQLSVNASQAEHYSLEINGPSQVMISLTGPPVRIRELRGMLSRNEVSVSLTVAVPDERLNEVRYSDTIVVDASSVHTPPGVTALVVEGRNRLPITLHRLVERQLPVHLDHVQEDVLGPVVLEPATVLVRGPQDVLDRTRFITTLPSEMPTRPANASPTAATVGKLSLVSDLEGRPVKVIPNRVTVRLSAQPRKIWELTDVPIQFLCPPGFAWRTKFYDEPSSKIKLRVLGPAQSDPPRVYAFVDLTRERYKSGLQHATLRVQLPKDFQLTQEQDQFHIVTFELEPADFIPIPIDALNP